MDILQMELLDIFAVLLFFISFFGIITSGSVIKSIIFIMLMQTSIVMFWLMLGSGTSPSPYPPIIYDEALMGHLGNIADPLPQALTLTAIIVGFSVVAVVITMLNAIFKKHSTTDWKKIEDMES